MAELAKTVVADGLSVRDVEQRVRAEGGRRIKSRGKEGAGTKGPVDSRSAETRDREDRLRKHLGTDVRIVSASKEKGELRIPYYSVEDFGRLFEILLGPEHDA
jgi:ParB family chromosome partitioning protein